MITVEEIKSLFTYKDGTLFWLVDKGRARLGDAVTGVNSYGYVCVRVDGIQHKAHNLIWVYHYGAIPEGFEVDHFNRIRNSNDISNLRLLTHSEQQFNRSNVKGYSMVNNGSFEARIVLHGKRISLGCYNSEKLASSAYLAGKVKYHKIESRVI